jgi:hypothetical protein
MAFTFQDLKQNGRTENEIREIKRLIMQTILDNKPGLDRVEEDEELYKDKAQ